MAQSDLNKLNAIKALFFDVDGVFTDGSIQISNDGDLLRTMHIRDGYAVKKAIEKGLAIVIITGGKSEGVRIRFQNLGVSEIHLGIENKALVFSDVVKRLRLQKEECLYMGDDYPDLEVMQLCGVKVCPKDAAWQIQQVADFISAKKGGKGCVREIIEKVLTLRDQWD